jgi:hypothetical protein
MATNMTGMRVEETTVAGAAARPGGANGRVIGVSGLMAAILIALLIAGVAAHDRRASHPAGPAIPRAATSQQTRFLENNTTNLPNAVTADPRPIVTSARQKFLDVNTTWLPGVNSAAAPSVMSSSQRRLLEVNTVMLPEGPSSPYAEDLTPLPGHRR